MILTKLIEVGRVLSKANEKALRAALEAITNVLAALNTGDATEAERSAQDKQKILRVAIKAKLEAAAPGVEIYCYIADVFDTYFVYEAGGNYYRADYAIDDAGAVIGEPTEVYPRVVYEPVNGGGEVTERKLSPEQFVKRIAENVRASGITIATNGESPEDIAKRVTKALQAVFAEKESNPAATDLVGDCVPLVEGADLREATAQLKVIQPGWGSSGYYSPTLLRRDGPTIFTAGTKMFWDHQTASEEASRPEGSLDRLAAELLEDAAYRDDGPAGPGLYARAKVFERYAGAVGELGPHIGVSIRASGITKAGEAEGRRGPIIEKLVSAKSIDFVTAPGAGGKVLQLFESAGRGPAPTNPAAPGRQEQESTMTETEIRALQEANAADKAELARLREGLLLRDARDFVTGKLAGITMPDLTRARLVEQLSARPLVKDGKLDEAAYTTRIEEAVRAEIEYLAKVSGSGRITGMGSDGTGGGAKDVTEADLTAAFQSYGLSESAAKTAARGR